MSITIEPRRSEDRGYIDHGWLKSYHTFNFAHYWDYRFASFGPLRVINEDIIQGGKGFPTHPHKEFEIWTYVVAGQIKHQDNTGIQEVVKRGQVQFTTAGTGISHSEFNAHPTESAHCIQIWAMPNQAKLQPSYQTMAWSESEKKNKLCLLIKPIEDQAEKAISCHAELYMYASILENENRVTHKIGENRKLYIHVVNTGGALLVNDVQLNSGDGAFITEAHNNDQLHIESLGSTPAEFLLFDMK
ncbi:RmlC-like cupin [Basidiobolus meristosporus CBS 931.73]|uniref:RmlC-like cupin n=1 Tax=Basidiobolus meristosporus CBS 931.73 TaxID=1314790 RepID=A0A1Y1Z8K3_9FUNG|nr:RmlC-like cupin [Basidiobolus meristosporus CBS 931.73]|eukprot:ORY06581.1 RmlC-like cupin [Basidiobolus meristosporus CBS 931.73]